MKAVVFIALLMGLFASVSGQDSSANRRIVINMLLDQSKARTERKSQDHSFYTSVAAPEQASQSFRRTDPIPRYCLAKGSIVCRLEEYVQLHSPFKLNIGVGGE